MAKSAKRVAAKTTAPRRPPPRPQAGTPFGLEDLSFDTRGMCDALEEIAKVAPKVAKGLGEITAAIHRVVEQQEVMADELASIRELLQARKSDHADGSGRS